MIGRKINNYEITALLGEGGMGSVYVAEHPVLGRRVAIKVLKREFTEDKTLVARFMNEARAATAIRQPNIIEILDVGTLPDGIPYLMMELLEGETLAGRLFRDKRLSVEEAVAVASQAATALGAAHAKGIVHRDLKPDNLFLVPDANAAGGHRVVVLDFGIAKLRGELSSGSVKTHTGSVMGTPPYMSPEQCRGLTDDIDHRTDIYALGIILHEMLSGAPPFVSAGFGDLIIKHITEPPTPLRRLDARIPGHLEAAVLRALEKPREARFGSMADLRGALLGTLAPTVATTSSLTGQERRAPEARVVEGPRTISTLSSATGERAVVDATPTVPLRRGRRLIAIGGGVVAAGALALALVLGSTTRRPDAPVAAVPPPPAAAPRAEPVPPGEPVRPAAQPPAAPEDPAPRIAAPAPLRAEPPHEALPAHKPVAISRVHRSKSHSADVSHAASRSPAAPPASPPAPPVAPPPVAAPRAPSQVRADKW
jgi:serine/threonine protein kinase